MHESLLRKFVWVGIQQRFNLFALLNNFFMFFFVWKMFTSYQFSFQETKLCALEDCKSIFEVNRTHFLKSSASVATPWPLSSVDIFLSKRKIKYILSLNIQSSFFKISYQTTSVNYVKRSTPCTQDVSCKCNNRILTVIVAPQLYFPHKRISYCDKSSLWHSLC